MTSSSSTIDMRGDRQETMRSIVWRQFRRHPLGLVAVVALCVIVAITVLAPVIAPYDPEALDLTNRFAPPSVDHLFGTDRLGRDMLSRILYGGRVSLLVGLLAMAVSVTIGTVIGALAGYLGGVMDNTLMRATDFFLIFPQLFVLLFVASVLQGSGVELVLGGVGQIVVVIAVMSWMPTARLVRSSFLKTKEEEYVSAARSYGAGGRRIVLLHILPIALGPILVAATRGVSEAIIIESGLSFLGYGIVEPDSSWGNILGGAQENIGVYPWLTLFPGLMIFLTVLALNYIGDALRDALDPYRVSSK